MLADAAFDMVPGDDAHADPQRNETGPEFTPLSASLRKTTLNSAYTAIVASGLMKQPQAAERSLF